MKTYNNRHLIAKLEDGIAYIQKQDEKLQPVLDYLTENCIRNMEELSPDKSFDYLIKFMNLKTESLLLLTKMKEIINYKDLRDSRR